MPPWQKPLMEVFCVEGAFGTPGAFDLPHLAALDSLDFVIFTKDKY